MPNKMLTNNNDNNPQPTNKTNVNITGLDGSIIQFVFNNNPLNISLDEIYLKYESEYGTPKQYINLFYLNSEHSILSSPTINLQLLIDCIQNTANSDYELTDDELEGEQEETKIEPEEELEEEKQNQIESSYEQHTINIDPPYINPGFKDKLNYIATNRQKFKSFHMTLHDLLYFDISLNEAEAEAEAEAEKIEEKIEEETKSNDEYEHEYHKTPNQLPKYNDKLLTPEQEEALKQVSLDFSPYAYNANNIITIILIICVLSGDIKLPQLYHEKESIKHETQKQQETISKQFANPTSFNHLIMKNLTNITCPFPIKLINSVGTKEEEQQWHKCLEYDWMCRDDRWEEYYKCPAYLIPQICEHHGYRNITIITNNSTADNCMDLYDQYSSLNKLRLKLKNEISLITFSLIIINIALIIINNSQRKCNKEFKKNMKKSGKNLNKLTQEIRSVDNNFQLDPNRIKEILVQYFDPISWPVIYLLTCMSINNCCNKIKTGSQNAINNISNACCAIFDICKCRNNRRPRGNMRGDIRRNIEQNRRSALIPNNDLLAPLTREDQLAEVQ